MANDRNGPTDIEKLACRRWSAFEDEAVGGDLAT